MDESTPDTDDTPHSRGRGAFPYCNVRFLLAASAVLSAVAAVIQAIKS